MTEQSETVTEVIDGRVDVYGDPVEGMTRTAQIWSGILGHEVKPADVPLMLIGYKLMRAQRTPDYSDNSDDAEGYLDIFRKVVGDKMIAARSVSDYLEQLTAQQKSDTTQPEKPGFEPVGKEVHAHFANLRRILPSFVVVGDYFTTASVTIPDRIQSVDELNITGANGRVYSKDMATIRFWRDTSVPGDLR